MENTVLRFTGAILLSLLIALALTILPLSEDWKLWRPEWIAMTLIHWALLLPKKMSLLLAWFMGLLVDALYGSILGQHAFGYTLIVFMALRLRPRLLVDSFLHQIFLLTLTLGTYLLINLWILGVSGNTPEPWVYWTPVISSVIVWPLYHYLLYRLFTEQKTFDY